MVKNGKNGKKIEIGVYKYNIIITISRVYSRVSIFAKMSSICSAIACPVCNKNSLGDCPCCGTTARKRLRIPPMISQFGWTTREGVNNYYNQCAQKDAKVMFNERIEQYKQKHVGISNSDMKRVLQKLEDTCFNIAKARYPFLPETKKHND